MLRRSTDVSQVGVAGPPTKNLNEVIGNSCQKFKALIRKDNLLFFKHPTNCITLTDQSLAKRKIVQSIQRETFPEEFMTHVKNTGKNRLKKLKPFLLDVLRVGGRLKHSDLALDAKHPIILPGRHFVTERVITHYHLHNGHVGAYQTLAEIRRKYWILKGIASVKRMLDANLQSVVNKLWHNSHMLEFQRVVIESLILFLQSGSTTLVHCS